MAKCLVQRTFSINTANDLLVKDFYDDGTEEDVSSSFQNVTKAPGAHRIRAYVDLSIDSNGKAKICGSYTSNALEEKAETDADMRILLDLLKIHHPEAVA